MNDEKEIDRNSDLDENNKSDNMQELKYQTEKILDNEIITFSDESSQHKENDAYQYIYSGKALNSDELFKFSAREDVKLVLVAGPFSSGKTTLEVMLYYLFLEGVNKELEFGGSVTLNGFKDRSSKLLCSSGESESIVERTRRLEEHYYLHLALVDRFGDKKNLIIADISGEKFERLDLLQDMGEIFIDSENIIVVVDGEKMCSESERKNAHLDTILLLKRLLTSQFLTKKTKLQIVYTKLDKIEEEKNKKDILDFINQKKTHFIEKYSKEIFSIDFYEVAALNIEKTCESEKLEKILIRCLEDVNIKTEKDISTNQIQLKRNFDKFKMKG